MSFIEYLKQNKCDENRDDKLSDRAFMRSIAISFFAIAVFIVIFSTSTFAWYRESIEATQTIQAAVYILDIGAEPIDAADPLITSSVDADGNILYTIPANTEYSFSILAVADDRTNGSTGYIIIESQGVQYYSEQIDRGELLEFTLRFNSETTIKIIERWGTSSVPHTERAITQGGSYLDMVKE